MTSKLSSVPNMLGLGIWEFIAICALDLQQGVSALRLNGEHVCLWLPQSMKDQGTKG